MAKIADRARRYAQLKRRHARLQALITKNTEEMNAVEEELLNSMLESGVNKLTLDGGITVHLREEVWSKLIVPEGMTPDEARFAAVQCLIEMGRDRLVTYNHQSMRALVSELMDEAGELPEPIGRYVRAEKVARVGVRGNKE